MAWAPVLLVSEVREPEYWVFVTRLESLCLFEAHILCLVGELDGGHHLLCCSWGLNALGFLLPEEFLFD